MRGEQPAPSPPAWIRTIGANRRPETRPIPAALQDREKTQNRQEAPLPPPAPTPLPPTRKTRKTPTSPGFAGLPPPPPPPASDPHRGVRRPAPASNAQPGLKSHDDRRPLRSLAAVFVYQPPQCTTFRSVRLGVCSRPHQRIERAAFGFDQLRRLPDPGSAAPDGPIGDLPPHSPLKSEEPHNPPQPGGGRL